MTISLLRVDERLLHGQVAVSWSSFLSINTILIANDEAQSDKTKAMVYDLAKPAGVKLYIRTVNESGGIIRKFNDSKKSHVLVLAKTIEDAYELIKSSGGVIKKLNIGGIRSTDEKKKFNDYVSLSDKEVEILNEISKLNIDVDFRMLPRDKKITIDQMLKEG